MNASARSAAGWDKPQLREPACHVTMAWGASLLCFLSAPTYIPNLAHPSFNLRSTGFYLGIKGWCSPPPGPNEEGLAAFATVRPRLKATITHPRICSWSVSRAVSYPLSRRCGLVVFTVIIVFRGPTTPWSGRVSSFSLSRVGEAGRAGVVYVWHLARIFPLSFSSFLPSLLSPLSAPRIRYRRSPHFFQEKEHSRGRGKGAWSLVRTCRCRW